MSFPGPDPRVRQPPARDRYPTMSDAGRDADGVSSFRCFRHSFARCYVANDDGGSGPAGGHAALSNDADGIAPATPRDTTTGRHRDSRAKQPVATRDDGYERRA